MAKHSMLNTEPIRRKTGIYKICSYRIKTKVRNRESELASKINLKLSLFKIHS